MKDKILDAIVEWFENSVEYTHIVRLEDGSVSAILDGYFYLDQLAEYVEKALKDENSQKEEASS